MKRPIESSEGESALPKKIKAHHELGPSGEGMLDTLCHAPKQLNATDVYERGTVADGFLAFQIHMKWENGSSQVHLQAQSIEHGETVRYDVFFLGPCVEYFNAIGLRFDINDALCLSLEGATLKKKAHSGSNIRTLPMEIIYDSGVRLKFTKKKHPLPSGTVVDSWQAPKRNSEEIPLQDDWFSTPPVLDANAQDSSTSTTFERVPPSDYAVNEPAFHEGQRHPSFNESGRSTSIESSSFEHSSVGSTDLMSKQHRGDADSYQRKPTSTDVNTRKMSPSTSDATTGVLNTTAPATLLAKERSSAHATKKGVKKAAREARKAAANAVSEPAKHSGEATPAAPLSTIIPPVVAPSALNVAQNSNIGSRGDLIPNMIPKSSTDGPLLTPEAPIAKLQTAPNIININDISGSWCSLSQLATGTASCIIGVIAFVGKGGMSASGERFQRVTLVDTSNVNKDKLTAGFSLTCFARAGNARDCLPDPSIGDVLVVRDAKVESYQGQLTGSCPSYKLWSWTMFRPRDGTLRSGGTALNPAEPTQPMLTAAENQYCIRLADWWLDISKEQMAGYANENAVAISIADVWSQGRSGGREHRLIKDASPLAPPSGYFDCTVEILHGHMNDNGVYSLYVTDYTRNESITPISASWCTPALADLVFKIELWNEASLKGSELKPGDYYEVKNVRMKESAGGYWEGSFSEVKRLRMLDDEALDGEPHLIELLRRKKAWQDEADANGTHKFPHRLIKDAQPDSHFDCTVEVLRISRKDDRALLYVTDYTSRSDLSFIAATADWTRNIDHDCILKVALFNAQVKVAEGLHDGDFIAIRKLRLKATVNGTISGLLGGEERLIYKLDPRSTGNEHCIALMRRKEVWESMQREIEDGKKTKRKGPRKKLIAHGSNDQDVKKTKKRVIPRRLPKTTCVRDLEKVHPDAGPGKFLILARVVDYYPDDLADFVSLYCSECGQDIPDHLRICTACDSDMADSFVRPYYKFVLMLEDDEGARLQVPMATTKERACGLLEDLEPVDLREDDDALEELKKKLRPLLGELIDKHQELLDSSADGELDPDTSYHNMLLAKPESSSSLCFWDYTPVQFHT